MTIPTPTEQTDVMMGLIQSIEDILESDDDKDLPTLRQLLGDFMLQHILYTHTPQEMADELVQAWYGCKTNDMMDGYLDGAKEHWLAQA